MNNKFDISKKSLNQSINRKCKVAIHYNEYENG